MKRILLLIALMVLVSTCVQGQAKDGQAKIKAKEFTLLQKAADEAEDKKGLAALDRLLADDYIFTAPGGAVTNKKQLIEEIKTNVPDAGQTISYDEATANVYGNAAVVNYILIVKARDKEGKDYAHRYRNTVVWVKQQGHWRIASIHVSRIRP